MTQELYELPEGWEWKKLMEICELTKTSINPEENKVYNYIGLENIESNTGKLIDFLPTQGSEISSTKTSFSKKSVLYGRLRPYLNKVIVAEFNGIASTEILPFKCKENITPKYLAYFFRSNYFVQLATSNCSGARMPRVTTKFIQKIAYIPVPKIEKQKKIIIKLDALFSRIDTAIEHLKNSLELNEQLFASSLHQAFNPLGAEIQPDGTYQLPNGWEWHNFKNLFSTKGYTVGKIKKSEYQDSGIYPVIDQSQKYIAGYFDEQNLVYQGELPVIVYGDHTNSIKYIDFEFISGADGTKVLTISKKLNPRYAYYLIENFKPKTQGYRRHYSIINKFKLPICNIETQELIGKKLFLLEHKIQASQQILQEKIQQLEKLKASLLNSAFRGEL